MINQDNTTEHYNFLISEAVKNKNKDLFKSIPYKYKPEIPSYPDDLIRYCKQNNIFKLKYIDLNIFSAELSCNNNFLEEMLFISVKLGNLDTIKNLVKNGVSIESNVNHILLNACFHGHLDIVKYAFNNGADIKFQQCRSFKLAIESGNLEIIKYLFQKKNIDVKDKLYLTHACKFNNLDIIKYLIEKGSDIIIEGHDSLRNACFYGELENVKYLIQLGVDIDFYTEAFLQASRRGHLSIVKYFVEKGVNVNINDTDALSLASREGRFDVIKYLIENGADIYAQNCDVMGNSICMQYKEISHYLLDREGLNIIKYAVENRINSKEQLINCILPWSVERDNLNAIKCLEENNLKIYAKKYKLMKLCTKHNSTKIMEYLEYR